MPPDPLQKARTHDAKKDSGLAIELQSHLSIDQQVGAIGATWLDLNLVVDGSAANQGFGARVRGATQSRADFLVEQGWQNAGVHAWFSL